MKFESNEDLTKAESLKEEIEGAGIAGDISSQVAMRAVEWFVDLQAEDDTDMTWQKLQQWRDQHADHERAWQHIEMINGRFQGLGSSAGRGM